MKRNRIEDDGCDYGNDSNDEIASVHESWTVLRNGRRRCFRIEFKIKVRHCDVGVVLMNMERIFWIC